MNKKAGIISSMRRVIGLEAETLHALSKALDDNYIRGVLAIAACKGKIIVIGTGKSGLIAQKIAATLASTGTPALFIHPSDGLHGSLGAVERKDLVLAIGKSGESEELNSLLPPLKKLGVKIIAMTSNRRSVLAKHASMVLHVPVRAEACPLNLAPTCSTTAALAAGDAIAVTLMRLRGFRTENFARLHPGGRLGKRLTLTVADVMHGGKDNPKIGINAPAAKMLIEITCKHTGAVSVIDKRGRFLGLITDFDLRRILERGEDIRLKPLKKIMNPRPTVVRPETLAAEAMEIMLNRKKPFAVLPVVDRRGRAVGMVHLHDIRRSGL